MRRLTIAAAIAGIALTMTACSSETTTDTTQPADTASSSAPATPDEEVAEEDVEVVEDAVESTDPAASEDPMVGTSPGTWSPVDVTLDMNGSTLSLVPEQAAIFTDLPANDEANNFVLETDNPAVVEVMQSTDDGTMQTNAGLVAVAPGTATVTVYNGFPADGEAEVVAQYTVVVADAPADSAAGTDGTDMVGSDMTDPTSAESPAAE